MTRKTAHNIGNRCTNIFKFNFLGLKEKIGLIRNDLSEAKYLII